VLIAPAQLQANLPELALGCGAPPSRGPLALASRDAGSIDREVRGDLIIVTKPGTSFSATYGKSKDEPNVILLASTEGWDGLLSVR
jgi:hypothetical protein